MFYKVFIMCSITAMVVSCSNKTPSANDTGSDQPAQKEEMLSEEEEQAITTVYESEAREEIVDENADSVADQLLAEIQKELASDNAM